MTTDVKFTDNSKEVLEMLSSAMEAALSEIGEKAVGYAKQNAPVDTGRLRDSIKYTVDPDEKSVSVGSDVEYAQYVENGTSRTKPRPFLGPAMSDHAQEYEQIMKSHMQDA